MPHCPPPRFNQHQALRHALPLRRPSRRLLLVEVEPRPPHGTRLRLLDADGNARLFRWVTQAGQSTSCILLTFISRARYRRWASPLPARPPRASALLDVPDRGVPAQSTWCTCCRRLARACTIASGFVQHLRLPELDLAGAPHAPAVPHGDAHLHGLLLPPPAELYARTGLWRLELRTECPHRRRGMRAHARARQGHSEPRPDDVTVVCELPPSLPSLC